LCHLNGVLCLSSQERSPRSFACTASFAGKSRLCTVIPMTAAQQKEPNSCANYSNRPVDVKRASSVRPAPPDQEVGPRNGKEEHQRQQAEVINDELGQLLAEGHYDHGDQVKPCAAAQHRRHEKTPEVQVEHAGS